MPTAKSHSFLLEPWQWDLLVLSTLLKLFLIPTYHSTDFEVHRNWLAITHSLPISQWYFDETSKWTLDYPPFFAYFSWLLSLPAAWWDPRIVDLKAGLEYEAWSCKVYMRLTVIVTEFVLAGALFALSRSRTSDQGNKSSVKQNTLPSWCAAAILLHPGLVFVDHIHFQYNGFLYGVLFWSIWAAREGRPLLCAFIFSSLLNFKHIYIYIAPAYFIYLLQTYVVRGQPAHKEAISISGTCERLFTLATITLLPFAASLLPVALSGLTPSAPAGPLGILKQMLSRLFPFSRGLTHAYWAANAWALYTFADRALVKILRLQSTHGNVTRGILGDIQFDVLPQITAGHCFLLTFACTLILCLRLWRRPSSGSFIEAIGLFGLTSFFFGFHVHEKAILIALLPLTLLASGSYTMMRKVFVLSVAGIVGLFPLLFQPRELPIKIIYTLLWLIMIPIGSTLGMRLTSRAGHFGNKTPTNWDLLVHFAEDAYLLGFVPLIVFVEFVHPLFFGNGDFSLRRSSSLSQGSLLAAIVQDTGREQSQNRLVSFVSAAAQSAADVIAEVAHDVKTSAVMPATETIVSIAASASSVAASAVQAAVTPMDGGGGAPAASSVSVMTSSVGAVANALASQASSIKAAIPSSIPENLTFSATDGGILEFLPLMMISVYCALGVLWVWLSLGIRYLRGADDAGDQFPDDSLRKMKDLNKITSNVKR